MAEPQTISGDTQFAEIVIREGYASQVQVQECLRIQADLSDKGTPRQLGAIMVERGYLSIQQVEEILDKLSKRTLECGSCNGRFTVRGFEPGQHYACPRCGNLLDSPPSDGMEELQPLGEVGGGMKLDPENLVNQTVGGCKVLEKLAIGGMGTIYKARQLSMNRLVVVKTLSEDLAKDKAYVQRFLQEARAAGELSHTNLIHVMDVGYQDGVFYYIMEFIDGINLDTILAQKGRIPVDQAIDVIIQTARALEQAHAQKIIHRDIKPDNIMITRDGVVKLADLGIAKKISSENMGVTEPGMVLGTPFYMAPEQGRDSRSVDHRSDIYGLGATFYHMLSGNVPFDGKTTLEIVMKSIEEEPPPLREVDETLPEEIVCVIEKMMKKRPEERYQSMGEVISDLDRIKSHKPLDWVAKMSHRQATPPPVPAVSARPASGGTKKRSEPAPQRPAPPLDDDEFSVEPQRHVTPPQSRHATPVSSKPAKLSAAKRRELGLDDSDLDVKPGSPAAAPAKPSVPSRPLPQRAAPQTGPAKVAGILADSQGATPGKIYKERHRDIIWPIVTVVGVLISVVVAFKLLKGAGSDQNPNSSGTDVPSHPGDNSGGGAKGDYDTEYARTALKEAKGYAESFPQDLDGQAERYLSVAEGYKGTASANTARALYEEVVTKRDGELQKEYDNVQTKIDVAKRSNQFGEALWAMEEFEKKRIPESWKNKVETDRQALLKQAKEVYDKAILEADTQNSNGLLWQAIERLEQERKIGVADLAAKIDIRLSGYEKEGYESQDKGMKAYRELREVNDPPTRPVTELLGKMKFEEAKKRLQDVSQSPSVRVVRSEVQADIADIETAVAFLQSAREGVLSIKGQMYDFHIRGGDGQKSGNRNETVTGVEGDKIQTIRADGKPSDITMSNLMHYQIVEFGLGALPPGVAESEQRAAVYYLVMGLIDEAEKQFLKAEDMGADVGAYLTRIEDMRIQHRLPDEPRMLYYSPSGERWDTRGGLWIEHQNEGYVAGGEVAGNFEYMPPQGPKWEEYVFKARAERVRGLNGFVICFHAFNKDMRWNLGDDGGKLCWVEGVPATKRTMEIEPERWYSVKLVATSRWLVGYVNNKRQWRIVPDDVRMAEPGLPSGWGIGVVATKAYFRDIKIWPLR